MVLDRFILSVMNKGEYNHLHGYQDQKDAFNEELNKLSSQIVDELWSCDASITNALTESLAESTKYISIIKHCHKNDGAQVLGVITLVLIDAYLMELAEERAEEELI